MEQTDGRPGVLQPASQRSIPVALILIAVLLVVARGVRFFLHEEPSPESPLVQGAELVQWIPLAQAQELSAQSGKPVLYDFTAEWCQPCHLLDDAVFRNEAFAADINEHFIPVRVVDRQQEDGRNPPDVQALQDLFQVRGFPTVIFADSSGVLARMEGFGGPDGFRRAMEQAR